jgi:hypothetical protein
MSSFSNLFIPFSVGENFTTQAAADAANTQYGLNALTQAFGFIQGNRDARRVARAKQATQDRIAKQSLDAYTKGVAFSRQRQARNRVLASQEIEQINRQGRRARASYAVTTGESGVTGQSAELIDQEYEKAIMAYELNVLDNLEVTQADIEYDMQLAKATGEGRIEAGRATPTASPSPLAFGLNVANAYYGARNDWGYFGPSVGPALPPPGSNPEQIITFIGDTYG